MAKEPKVIGGLSGNDFVSAGINGGTLKEHNCEGEWVTDIYVPPGRHRASRFMVGIGRRHQLLPGDGVTAFPPDQRHAPSDFGDAQYETAASQNFQVDRQEREKRRNDRLERRLNAQERHMALTERALARAHDAEQQRLREQAESEAAAAALLAGNPPASDATT